MQLSDLHLLAEPREQPAILNGLEQALRSIRQQKGASPDLIALTGDVFESATLDPDLACRAFLHLYRRIQDALGGNVPTVIIPGNHDRRQIGLFGPHRDELFCALKERVDSTAFVHGTEIPFLSAVVPPSFHRLPLWLIAYDSTYLPQGFVSAGGAIRQEDLLRSAAEIGNQQPDWPVLFLLHHHLVPTPITDLGVIEIERTPKMVRWGLKHMLPRVVANADREELTMTALGAGTALSTLHTLGRAVLVLHGHKHYANARLLSGIASGQGDVLLVSAGSAGSAQAWNPNDAAHTARLWPSFNLVELNETHLSVDTVAFGWKGASLGHTNLRPMVRARRDGAHWRLLPLPRPAEDPVLGPELRRNEAVYRLSPSARFGSGRYDYHWERRLEKVAGTRLRSYIEPLDPLGEARVIRKSSGALEAMNGCREVVLNMDGSTHFFVEGGALRSLDEAYRCLGSRGTPFASVSLMNRYQCHESHLAVEGLDVHGAFASRTDLGTGQEHPLSLQNGSARASVSVTNCPPRTLIRIYWPLSGPNQALLPARL